MQLFGHTVFGDVPPASDETLRRGVKGVGAARQFYWLGLCGKVNLSLQPHKGNVMLVTAVPALVGGMTYKIPDAHVSS